jgi:regulation of enolase protein 1 (concanavalin A-like superfamily)
MPDIDLHEDFSKPLLHPALRWQAEPARWHIDRERACLCIAPDAKTDFWQRTHYGFEVDNGHFLYLETTGDFVLTTQVRLRPLHQYDQAGLMLRLSPACWVKTSIEFEPEGSNRLGAVVTNAGYSDWSTQSIGQEVDAIWLRIRAEAEDCIVDASLDGQAWLQIRMAHLGEHSVGEPVRCGLYACSPKGAGFRAEFQRLDFAAGRL